MKKNKINTHTHTYLYITLHLSKFWILTLTLQQCRWTTETSWIHRQHSNCSGHVRGNVYDIYIAGCRMALGTCRGLRSTWCWPLLALGSPRTGRTRQASGTRGGVSPCYFNCLCDAVPWVTSHNCWWDGRSSISLLLRCVAFIPFILIFIEWVGRWRGCAGSGVLPFERGQRACIWDCCLSGRGWGRGFFLLVFRLYQGEPRWVFRFMGATGQAGHWNTDMDGGVTEGKTTR